MAKEIGAIFLDLCINPRLVEVETKNARDDQVDF